MIQRHDDMTMKEEASVLQYLRSENRAFETDLANFDRYWQILIRFHDMRRDRRVSHAFPAINGDKKKWRQGVRLLSSIWCHVSLWPQQDYSFQQILGPNEITDRISSLMNAVADGKKVLQKMRRSVRMSRSLNLAPRT